MSLLNNLLIISENKDLQKELLKYFEQHNKVAATAHSDRSKILGLLREKIYKAIIIDDAVDKQTVSLVCRSLMSGLLDNSMFIYFLSQSADKAREYLNIFKENENIVVVNMPTPPDEIGRNIINNIFPKNYSEQSEQNRYTVDMDFVEIFISSTIKVISDMTSDEDITHTKPSLLSKEKKTEKIGIRGKIVINSKFFRGSFFISFPTKTYLAIYKQVVQEDHSEINDENRDFAMELVNIIYGQAKNQLSSSGIVLDMIIPAIDDRPSLPLTHPIIVIPMTSKLGTFYIKVAPDLI